MPADDSLSDEQFSAAKPPEPEATPKMSRREEKAHGVTRPHIKNERRRPKRGPKRYPPKD